MRMLRIFTTQSLPGSGGGNAPPQTGAVVAGLKNLEAIFSIFG
jgi:hypothetical protein